MSCVACLSMAGTVLSRHLFLFLTKIEIFSLCPVYTGSSVSRWSATKPHSELRWLPPGGGPVLRARVTQAETGASSDENIGCTLDSEVDWCHQICMTEENGNIIDHVMMLWWFPAVSWSLSPQQALDATRKHTCERAYRHIHRGVGKQRKWSMAGKRTEIYTSECWNCEMLWKLCLSHSSDVRDIFTLGGNKSRQPLNIMEFHKGIRVTDVVVKKYCHKWIF